MTTHLTPPPDPMLPVTRGTRRRAAQWLLALATAGVGLAAALMLAPPVILLPVVGVLLAAIAPPSSGPAARYVVWTRRSLYVLAAMIVGCALMIITASPRGSVFLTEHLSRPYASAAISALIAILVAVMALPLALPESAEPVDTLPRRKAVFTRRDAVLATTGLVALLVAHIFASSFVLFGVAIILPPVIAALRVRDARRRQLVTVLSHPLDPDRRGQLLQAVNRSVFWALLAATTLTGAVDPLSFLGLGVSPSVIRSTVVVACAAGMLLAWVAAPRVLLGVNMLAVAGSLFMISQLIGVYRAPVDPVMLPTPVTGQWYVVQGGRAEVVNGHRAALMQDDALDIVQVVDGATHTGDGQDLTSYFCYGQPLLALPLGGWRRSRPGCRTSRSGQRILAMRPGTMS